MSSETSKLEIANQALAHLGQEPLLTYTDESSNGNAIRTFYNTARIALLEEGNWSFATERVSLAPASPVPEFGYTNKFLLPADFLNVDELLDSGNSPIKNYKIERGHLLADKTEIRLVYVSKDVSEGDFSGKFAELLAFKLASLSAYRILKSVTEAKQRVELFETQLFATLSNDDSGDSENKVVNSPTWTEEV